MSCPRLAAYLFAAAQPPPTRIGSTARPVQPVAAARLDPPDLPLPAPGSRGRPRGFRAALNRVAVHVGEVPVTRGDRGHRPRSIEFARQIRADRVPPDRPADREALKARDRRGDPKPMLDPRLVRAATEDQTADLVAAASP